MVRALGIWIFEPDRSCLWVTWWTLGGTKFFKYAGTSLLTILKNVTILCLYLLCSRLSHPFSSRSLLFEHDLVAPVTILAASFCTLSISSFFCFWSVVPNYISILQSWPNERYVNCCQRFWTSLYISDLRIFILFQAFAEISRMCSYHEHVFLIISPKCLWEFTFWISTLFITKLVCLGGTAFLEMIICSVLFGLKLTSQDWALWWIFCKSEFIRSAAVSGSSTIR